MKNVKVGKEFELLFGKRVPIKGFDVNGRGPAAEVYVLKDGSALTASASMFFDGGDGTGQRKVSVELMLAVKSASEWETWVRENGWDFKGNFFASLAFFEEKVNSGKPALPELAWRALNDENENVAAMVKDGLERVFGREMLEEALLLDGTPKVSSKRLPGTRRL